jgi:DNA-binding winged helix-turn-helix (wHTH) protein/tetratricopeptide (TPR) repeat protein
MTKLRELVSHPLSYEFDEFRIDVRQRSLFKNGEIVPLQPKILALLLALVRNPGIELSKEYLMRAVWPDSYVDTSNLTQSMFLLRRVLEQNSDGRRLIVTIPGQGYLFVGTLRVEPGKQIAVESASNPAEDQAPRRRSIAVLPLLVFDSSDQTQYLGVGIADALINRLSHIEQTDVRPTGTILRYTGHIQNAQDIGRELGVGLLITGTIHIERNRDTSLSPIRVTVQLVDVQDGRLIWSDSVKHDLSNILSLQDTLAEKLGHAVSKRLTVQEQSQLTKRYTDNNEAYQDYLKGRYYAAQWTIRGWTKSIECFSKAVRRDSNYALAYCGIADAHYMASNLYSPPIEVMPKAQTAASRALELDDTLAEVHTSVGLVKGFFEWNWEEAEASFRRAIRLNPRYAAARLWYGRLLATSGYFDEAIDELKMSQRLDPLSPGVNAELGRAMYYARRYDEATEQLRETLELDPDFWPAHLFLGWVYEQQGHSTEAVAILRRSSELDDNPRTKASLGVAYAFAGNEAEAEKILISLVEESKKRHVSAYYIAAIHSALGDNARAFRWFAKALADRSEWLVWLRVDPRFDALRQDHRFESLARRVGIPMNTSKKTTVASKNGDIGLIRGNWRSGIKKQK